MTRFLLPVLLLALAAAVLPAQEIKINEFNTGTPDFLELLNRSVAAVDVGGWTVTTWNKATSTGAVATDGTFTIPAGTILQPGARLVLQELGTPGLPGTLTPCSISLGYNLNWATGYAVEIALRNAAAQGIDYVYRNPFGGAASPNLPAGTIWTGTLIATGDSVARNGNVDTNSAADWAVGAGTGTPCSLNPGQTFSLPAPVQLSITTTGVGDVTVSVSTSPVVPNAEFFNLYSTQNFTPNGSGPFFGVGFDVLPQIYFPLIPNTPFHSLLNASGALLVSYPPGTIPTGLFFEGVSIVVAPPALLSSDVVEITF